MGRADNSMSGRRERGVAAIEFALIIPFVTILVLALIDYGYYFYIGVNATEAARAAGVQVDTSVAAMNAGAGVANCSDANISTLVTAATAPPNLTAQAYMTTTINATIGGGTTATIGCAMLGATPKPVWSIVVTVTFAPPSGSVHFGLPASGSNLVYTTHVLWRR